MIIKKHHNQSMEKDCITFIWQWLTSQLLYSNGLHIIQLYGNRLHHSQSSGNGRHHSQCTVMTYISVNYMVIDDITVNHLEVRLHQSQSSGNGITSESIIWKWGYITMTSQSVYSNGLHHIFNSQLPASIKYLDYFASHFQIV